MAAQLSARARGGLGPDDLVRPAGLPDREPGVADPRRLRPWGLRRGAGDRDLPRHLRAHLDAGGPPRRADRPGGLRIAATLTALSCLAIAGLAQSSFSLTALLVVGGLANAFGGPSVAALLKREVAVHRQGLAFGAQQSGATLASLRAELALPLVAIPFGWR
jgi:hypothetical protein